jgi:hypothetical protein
MRFRGVSVGHKSTREATQTFSADRDALDSVPFTKESEFTGMVCMPDSPMDEDEFHGSANDDVDEDMNSAGRDSDNVEGNVDEGATGRGPRRQ